MHKDPITISEIEQYLFGALSPDRQADFEKRLSEDENANQQMVQLKEIIEGTQGYAFKQKLKEFHRKNFPDNKVNDAD